MSEWTELYVGNPAAAEALCEFLGSRSVPTLKTFTDEADLVAGELPTVRVEVPVALLDGARRALEDWQLPQARRAEELARRVVGVVVLSFLPPALWLGASWLAVPQTPEPGGGLLLVVWLVSLVGIGQLEDRRHREGEIRGVRPKSEPGPDR